MCKEIGLIAFVPTAVLVTISFFVLLTLRKVETQGLKALGYLATVLLWIAALAVLSLGISAISGFGSSRMCMSPEMMRGHMQGMGMQGMGMTMQGMPGQQRQGMPGQQMQGGQSNAPRQGMTPSLGQQPQGQDSSR